MIQFGMILLLLVFVLLQPLLLTQQDLVWLALIQIIGIIYH